MLWGQFSRRRNGQNPPPSLLSRGERGVNTEHARQQQGIGKQERSEGACEVGLQGQMRRPGRRASVSENHRVCGIAVRQRPGIGGSTGHEVRPPRPVAQGVKAPLCLQ